MIVSVRRHRPRAVLTVMLASILALLVYGHLGRGFGQLSELSTAQTNLMIGSSLLEGLVGGGITVEGAQLPFESFTHPPKGGVPPSKEMLRYWKQLLKAMVDAKPKTDETVQILESVTDHDIQPNPLLDKDRARIDKTHLGDDLRIAIKTAHTDFARIARSLGAQLPYTGKTFGKPAVATSIKMGDGKSSESKSESERGTTRKSEKDKGQAKMEMRGKIRAKTESRKPGDVEADMPKAHVDGPSRGIVMTAGGSYVGIAVTSILMLRRNGSKLPVQLFLDNDEDYNERLCEKVLPSLGAECHIMQRFWETTPDMPKLERFQFKVVSILLSSFQEVLFFDADCWPIHNPDYLFDSAPFTTHGLVTWPDFWLSTTSPVLYDILDIAPPLLTERRSSESGVMMYDKARHGTSLIMAAYYNFYGPSYYYPLLSQGAIGQGDKETFLHGAMVMGNPFYAVHTRIGILGRWLNGTYVGAAMRQADPAEDYRLVTEKEAEGRSKAHSHPLKSGKALKGQKDGSAAANKENTAEPKVAADLASQDEAQQQPGLSPEEAAKRKDEDESVHGRWLFVHHNLFKIDLRHLGKSMRGVYAKNEAGAQTRLWDVEHDFNEDAGYDVERAMWDEVRKAVCWHTFLSTKECDDFQKYYKTVFE